VAAVEIASEEGADLVEHFGRFGGFGFHPATHKTKTARVGDPGGLGFGSGR